VPSTTLLTTAQVAERTGYSVRTITRWVDEGRITPAHKLPGDKGAFLFDEAELRKLPRKIEPESVA
jgi:excisionase family DNA binding protein